MEMLKKRIGFALFATVLVAMPAFGQQTPAVQNPYKGLPEKTEVNFSGPAVPVGGNANASLAFGPPGIAHVTQTPNVQQTMPVLPTQNRVPANNRSRLFQPPTVPHITSTPAQTARPVAQNAITQNYRLRLAPQVFEKNLIEKLGNRFVPIRNTSETPGISRYNLPGRDGTNIELVVHQQQGAVSVIGSPRMVESTLQIVRLLDTADTPGGAVTRFVPVQQTNVESARRVADIMNQETVRVAQVDRPTTPVPSVPALVSPEGESVLPGDPALGRVLGTVNIDVVPDFNTIIIQGTPNDVAVVQEILKQLEMLSLENEPIIELLPIHGDSVRVYQLASQLYTSIYQNRRGPVIMYPLVKPNTILMIGRRESVDVAKELVYKLDTPVDPNAAFRVFALKHAASDTLATQIQQMITSRPNAGVGLAPMATVFSDFRTNSLIVLANQREMMEVEAMIRQLDVPGAAPTTFMKYFQLKNAMAQDMVTVITTAFSNSTTIGRGAMLSVQGTGAVDADGNPVRGSVMYNVNVTADTRSNTLIVTAPLETMPLIEALVYQLDQLPAAESRIKVFPLANGNAFDLTTVLTNIFAAGQANQVTAARPGIEEGESSLVGIRFQADVRSNSIIAVGSEGDLATAYALILHLDSKNLNNRQVFTMRLQNTPADELAPILNNFATNERAIATQNTGTFLPRSPLEQYQMETYVVAEPISNSLIITTSPQYYEQIKQIITDVDIRPQMVAIDVLIAEVTLNNSLDRGVELALQDSILFGSTSSTAVNGLLRPGTIPFVSTQTGTIGTQGITSLVPTTATGGFSLSASSESVSMFIRALEVRNKTQILSRPQLKTLHNMQAQIQVGGEIPYVASTDYSAAGNPRNVTEFVPIGTRLEVLPRVMQDDMISIAVYIERSGLQAWVPLGGDTLAPQTNVTYASTTINAQDGQTVVFAGLISETKTSNNSSIPGLNKIPFVKHFFEYDSKDCKRTELLILMTPRIVRSQEQMDLLNQQERERMSWCVGDVVKMTGDGSIRRRTDEWYPSEVRHTYGTPTLLRDTQLPPESKKPVIVPVLPTGEPK